MLRLISRVCEKSFSSASPSFHRIARCRLVKSSLKRASISNTASPLFINTSRHITGSDAAIRVKSLNPPALYLITSLCVTASKSAAVPTILNAIKCGTWLVIASTRSWWSASMISTSDPMACHKSEIVATACLSVSASGVRIHQRLSNSSANPASGPESSVPAIGCAGTKTACSGK